MSEQKEAMISVPAAALKQLLDAFHGPDHFVMELKYTMSIDRLMKGPRNPVCELTEVYNEFATKANKQKDSDAN